MRFGGRRLWQEIFPQVHDISAYPDGGGFHLDRAFRDGTERGDHHTLPGCGTAFDEGARLVGGTAGIDQRPRDALAVGYPHQNHQRIDTQEAIPVLPEAVAIPSGDHRERAGDATRGERNRGQRGNGDGRTDAGHHSTATPRRAR